VTPSELREGMFDGDKTRMIELPYNEKNYDNMFHQIPGRYGQTDGQTELLYKYRASVKCKIIHSLTKVLRGVRRPVCKDGFSTQL